MKDVSDSLVVNQDKAKRFELTPVWAPAEPPAKRAKTAEVRLSSASNVPRPPKSDENEKGSSEEEDSDSSGSNSDVSSQDDSSDVSDLEKFDEAYTDFGALTKNVDPRTLERDGSANQNEEVPGIDLPGGMKALHSLANVPKSWPLARLTIPLSAARDSVLLRSSAVSKRCSLVSSRKLSGIVLSSSVPSIFVGYVISPSSRIYSSIR